MDDDRRLSRSDSIPRPPELVARIQAAAEGSISDADLAALVDEAVRSTVSDLERDRSPVITDGEQRKPSFATYPVAGRRDSSLQTAS